MVENNQSTNIKRWHEKEKDKKRELYKEMTIDMYIKAQINDIFTYHNVELTKLDFENILNLLKKKRNNEESISLKNIGEKYGLSKSCISGINQTYVFVKDESTAANNPIQEIIHKYMVNNKLTVKEMAAQLGVSKSMLSMVLNNQRQFSDFKTKLILEKIKEMQK